MKLLIVDDEELTRTGVITSPCWNVWKSFFLILFRSS